MKRIFGVLAVLGAVHAACAAGDAVFREPVSLDPQHPPRVLLEKSWGREIEAANPTELDEKDKDMLLGTVVADTGLPLFIVVDYAAIELARSDRPADNKGKLFLRLECPKEKYQRCGEDLYTYARHDWWMSPSGSFTRTALKIGTTTRDAHVMQGVLRYDVHPGAEVRIYMSRAAVPKRLETHRLRVRVMSGAVSFYPPEKKRNFATISEMGRHAVLAALIATGLAWLFLLIRPGETAPEFRPVAFGSLLVLCGSALTIAGHLSDPLLFYPVTGLLMAISGALLSAGSRFGTWCYGLMLVAAWGITLNDYGVGFSKEAFMRIGLISGLAFYVFSSGMSARLGNPEMDGEDAE